MWTPLVCPLRFLVIFARRLGNVQSFKTHVFNFWAFCHEYDPIQAGYPTLRRLHGKFSLRLTGLPYLADRATRLGGLPHLSCKRDQDLIRDYMERRVTSPTLGPPPPCKQALNLRSEQGPKYDTLSSTGLRHSMEWWSGGMAEYSTTRNALLCETKISQKWNCNEMRKLFIINRQIWILKER